MLTSLQIKDLAIIETLELTLARGLTVLTGETGAGKSIVVDALQLLAGGRAGAEVVRHGAERAEVSGTFDLAAAPAALTAWLAEQSLQLEGELIIRRVVGADGRSRAYLNGQAVPLSLLREAGSLLIDIHGQHEFQSLTRAASQRELLDAYARHDARLREVVEAHRAWASLSGQVERLTEAARDRTARLELLSYQVQELSALQLKEGEVEALTEERTRHSHGGRLAQGASQALSLLYEAEGTSAHAALARALAGLRPLAGLDSRLAPLLPMIEEAAIQVREAARELSHYGESLEVDSARQDAVERRLAAIEDLARKHRVAPAELVGRAAAAAAELELLRRADTDLAALRGELGAALTRYEERSEALSASRAKAARAMAKDITARMQALGMAGGRFEVELMQRGGEPAEHGRDQIELKVSANPGQPPRGLAKVASGGELARLSLAVQVAVSAQETRCMVFDEVDSGIGGAVAEIVGRELRALGGCGQVLCVTHLPQVAAQGHQHLQVVKLTDGQTTRTQLSSLAPAERIEEVARMLGGLTITPKAREHAREMLGAADSSERPRRRAAAPR
jgi:DNA repair protein RecN (Recombination protein N)